MHGQDPAVNRLDFHLEGENSVIFLDDEKIANKIESNKLTKLTAWFKLNVDDPHANQYLYNEIPKHYIWKSDKQLWQRRKSNKKSSMIGRMYFVNPNETERFSMRLLLLNTPGAKSFLHLKTANGITYDSYQRCANERGLLQDDKSWDKTLTEGSLNITNTQNFRELFCTILCFGNPTNPGKLWD